MTYKADMMKKARAKAKDELVKLYLSCNSFAEFQVRVAAEVPYAKKLDLIACRLHYWKKEYGETLWYSIWLLAPCVLIAGGAVIGALFGTGDNDPSMFIGAVVGLSAWLLDIMLYLELFSNFMQKLEWYENACPQDN